MDLPGQSLQLRADSAAGRPSLIPTLTLALALALALGLGLGLGLGLSVALFAIVLLLARDVRRRALAERSLAEALAFRQAMEDSLSAGLRARDLDGHITYVNPAFCSRVGLRADELDGHTTQPYWPPDQVDEQNTRAVRPCGWRRRRTATRRAKASRPFSCARTANAFRS